MKLSLCKNNNPAQDFKWVVSSFSEHRRMQRCKDDEGNLWCSPLRLFSCLPPNPPSGATHWHTTCISLFCISLCTVYTCTVRFTVLFVLFMWTILCSIPSGAKHTAFHCFAFLCMFCFTNAFYFASQCFASLGVYKKLVQLCQHLKLYNSGL